MIQMLKLMILLLVVLLLLLIVQAKEGSPPITIHKVRLEQCNTKCKASLIHNVDRLVSFAEANLSSISNLDDYAVAFKVQKNVSSHFKTVCSVHLKDPCKKDPELFCYCTKNESIHNFVLNITASKSNSYAKIMATVVLRNNGDVSKSGISNIWPIIEQAPEIKEHNISINNQSVRNQTKIQIQNEKSVVVDFWCSTDSVVEKNCCLSYGINDKDFIDLKDNWMNLSSFGNIEKLFVRLAACGKVSVNYELELAYAQESSTNDVGFSTEISSTTKGFVCNGESQSLEAIYPQLIGIVSAIIVVNILITTGIVLLIWFVLKRRKNNKNHNNEEEKESLKTTPYA